MYNFLSSNWSLTSAFTKNSDMGGIIIKEDLRKILDSKMYWYDEVLFATLWDGKCKGNEFTLSVRIIQSCFGDRAHQLFSLMMKMCIICEQKTYVSKNIKYVSSTFSITIHSGRKLTTE